MQIPDFRLFNFKRDTIDLMSVCLLFWQLDIQASTFNILE